MVVFHVAVNALLSRLLYFAQVAGSRYSLLVVDKGVK